MSALAKKLLVRPGQRILVRGAPSALSFALPEGATLVSRGAADVGVYFVKTAKEVEALAARPGALPAVTWLAYPKKRSGMASELTRDEGWDALFARGFIGISSIAIDETWSAIRIRLGTDEERARAAALRASIRRPAEQRKTSRPPAELPPDLVKAIARIAAAKKTAATLAPSHVREYATWIEGAKKAETRAARVDEAVAMLALGQRDRNAKYR